MKNTNKLPKSVNNTLNRIGLSKKSAEWGFEKLKSPKASSKVVRRRLNWQKNRPESIKNKNTLPEKGEEKDQMLI